MDTAAQFCFEGGLNMSRDKSERTPLMKAVVDSDEATLRRLLAEGRSVDEATPLKAGFLGVGSTGGFTALHMAASAGNDVAIPLLIQHGANREAREAASRMTPLLLAAFSGKEEAVAALAACTVDVEARDAFGNTALHFCVKSNLKRAVTALVEAGASPSTADVDLAAEYGDDEVIAMLRAAQARKTEEALAKKRAKEKLQATRRSSGQCIMCGRKLNVVQRWLGKYKHTECKSFME
jgi:ankyrin repeat protein